jgi:hypothetical protein
MTGLNPKPASARTRNSRIWWYIDETRCQQFHATIPCAGIAGSQFGIPQIGGVGFQAQQRIVGTFAPVTGIVTDLCLLLAPEHRDHTAIEVKDQAGAVVWPVDETLQQSIIHSVHLLQKRVRSLMQETAQRLWIREARQPSQVLEGTVET